MITINLLEVQYHKSNKPHSAQRMQTSIKASNLESDLGLESRFLH